MNDKLKVIGKILLVIVCALGFLVFLALCAYHILYNTETLLRAIALMVWSAGVSVATCIANIVVNIVVIDSIRRK